MALRRWIRLAPAGDDRPAASPLFVESCAPPHLPESQPHAWRRTIRPLEDRGSCPGSSPGQRTHDAVRRIGAILASAPTGHRLVRDRGCRRILASRLAERFDPANAVAAPFKAGHAREAGPGVPTVLADAGVENRNGDIDRLTASGLLRRVLAMTELSFSNSMIEAFWRVLKHQWLFLNSLDSIGKLRGLVEFYVREHNARLPHSAFRGQTPDEMYFGTGEGVPAQLEAGRASAREARLRENRRQACPACAGDPPEDYVAT